MVKTRLAGLAKKSSLRSNIISKNPDSQKIVKNDDYGRNLQYDYDYYNEITTNPTGNIKLIIGIIVPAVLAAWIITCTCICCLCCRPNNETNVNYQNE